MGFFDGLKVASMLMDINTFKDEVVFPNISVINNNEEMKADFHQKVTEYFNVACVIAESSDVKLQIKEAKSAYNKAVLCRNSDITKSTALFLVSMQVMLMCYYAKYSPLRNNINPIIYDIEEEIFKILEVNEEESLLYYYRSILGI